MADSLSPLQHFQLIGRLIQELYHLNFTLLQDDAQIFGFCRQYCYHFSQKEFTVSGIRELTRELTDSNILHIIDEFRIHTLFFSIEGTCIVMGPFCSVLFSKKDARTLLSGQSLPVSNSLDFLSYSSAFPCISEKDAIKTVHSIFHSIYPSCDDRTVISSQPAYPPVQQSEANSEQDRINYALLLEKRYSYENNFRKAIAEGNQRSALLYLKNMEQDVSYLKRIGSTLENEKIGAAITRTTARLTAIDCGLPAILADRISNQNTKDTLNAKTVDAISEAKQKMIRDYCVAIRAAKESHYSALVQSVLYAIEHNFHDNISLTDIAKELAISKNHMIHRFHEEVGQTPIQYLTEFRMKRAALLLTKHDLTVQDVANTVGISDSNYFTKLFKKAYGMTPLQYRRHRII